MRTVEGSYYDPETIELMRVVLEQAWAALSPEQRAAASKAELAGRILKRAAMGERDPVRLRAAAFIVEVGPSESRTNGRSG